MIMVLEKLYEEGYLNYQNLLLNKYKMLEISERDVIVLIKVMDLYKSNKKIRVSKLSQETGISKKEIEESLDNLLTKNIYGLEVALNDSGLNEERYSLTPLFDKLELLFIKETSLEIDEALKNIVKIYEHEILRPVTPQEYVVIEGFIKNDGFSPKEVLESIKEAVKVGKVNLGFIEKNLIKNKEKNLGSQPLDEEKAKKLNKIMDLLK